MEFRDVVRARRMVRAYDPDRPVPREVVDRALRHAIRAPSAGFSQGWDFVVLTREEERGRFWSASTGEVARERRDSWLRGVSSAPCLVVCLSDKQAYLDRYAEPDKGLTNRSEEHWPVPYWDVDTGMAALLMLLTAVDEGLGGLFFGVPADRQEATLDALGAPPDRRIVGAVAMGYAAPDRPSPSLRRGRRPVGEVAHEGRFGTPWTG
ncbi:nitroreductase family protein [Serinicoccus marinus]|uniref:nitroreductase family protein n=1 Tax=Serinicoccus marinus TaxID=247333 RepID=UPI0003B4F9E9|nr:nitroreductase family protein [Serinicoccus marinus]